MKLVHLVGFITKKTYYSVLLNVNVTVFWNTQNSLRRYRIPYDNVAVVWVIILRRNDKNLQGYLIWPST